MLGYQPGVKGYRLWSIEPGSHKLIISRDVKFDEAKMPFAEVKQKPAADAVHHDIGAEVELTGVETKDKDVEGTSQPTTPDDQEETIPEESTSQNQNLDNYLLARDRVRRKDIRMPARYSQADMIFYALCVAEHIEYSEPSTFSEAMKSTEREKWKKAMIDEIKSLLKNGTWILVKRSDLQKPIGCKWIFKRKVEVTGTEKLRYKARLVAKGYSQKEGVDFNEVFSPVVKHSSIRILMSVVAQNDWELHQMDVKTAFLHGSLEETIYMLQPEGFVAPGDESKVCLLKRSLYGLKQSSRQWYLKFDEGMQKLGFEKSKFDGCVYIRYRKGVAVAWLLLYVDDMLIAGPEIEEIRTIKRQLSSVFEMKDLGCAKRILGIDILRNRRERKLWLFQSDYIGRMLKKYQMDNSKGVSTPLSQQFKLSENQKPKTDYERKEMDQIPYSNIVGSLMYTMVCTRPDLAQAMSVVSRYMSDPGKSHWQAVKWVMRYVKQSQDIGIMYGGVKDTRSSPLVGFCDSDYATNLDNRKSQTGYIFKLYGAAVSWKSTLQSVVALSTTEAEYIALTEAIKEGIWLRGIIRDFGVKQEVVKVLCDSNSAICLAKHQVFHERSKHIDVRLHFIRDEIAKGNIEVLKVGTEDNAADALTKVLPVSKLKHCLKLVNVVSH